MTRDDMMCDNSNAFYDYIDTQHNIQPDISKKEYIYIYYTKCEDDAYVFYKGEKCKYKFNKSNVLYILLYRRAYSDIINCIRPNYLCEIFHKITNFSNPDDSSGRNTDLPEHCYQLIEEAQKFNRDIVFDYIKCNYKSFKIVITFTVIKTIGSIKIEEDTIISNYEHDYKHNEIFLIVRQLKKYNNRKAEFNHIFELLDKISILNGD